MTGTTPSFSPASRERLTRHDLGRFAGSTMFDRIGRVLCAAECLPRRELYEAWEVARRARRRFRGGRVLDLAAGHGLLAHLMLLLDDSSPNALAVDRQLAPSASTVHEALQAAWPRLHDRVALVQADMNSLEIERDDVVVSSHACGALTDAVLARAAAAGARVAVMPCCHRLDTADAKAFAGWADGALAIDIARVQRLRDLGYQVWTQTIAAGITAKARLILAAPHD